MNIQYEIYPSTLPSAESVLALFAAAGISKPNWSAPRLERSMKGSSVIVCAYSDGELVGYASALTDHAWVGYLSQLAVNPRFQKNGIGKKLVHSITEDFGEEVTLVLHSSVNASAFYESLGFELYENVYRLQRKR